MRVKTRNKLIKVLLAAVMVFVLKPSIQIHADDSAVMNIWIGSNGCIWEDENANEDTYFDVDDNGKMSEVTANDTWKLHYNHTSQTLVMNNFVFVGNLNSTIGSATNLTIELIGTNKITSNAAEPIYVEGILTIKGDGNLTLIATNEAFQPTDDNGDPIDEPYAPCAISAKGLTNRATIVATSENDDLDISLYDDVNQVNLKDIVNTGTITGRIGAMDGCYQGMKAADIVGYEAPTDHAYIAKVYYYTDEFYYPNNRAVIDASEWSVIGKYDANGKPLPSKIYYQYWYVDANGGSLTEDIHNPKMYLVYDADPETLVKDKDIVSIVDGKAHVFNADLYSVWFTDGDVTVNGNVILDCAVFDPCEKDRNDIKNVNGQDYMKLIKDASGNIVYMNRSTNNSKLTIYGNVGLLSLNTSFSGNVTVNGNIDLVGHYDDDNPAREYDGLDIDEEFYGSKTKAGHVVNNGIFSGISTNAIEGYLGYSVYNTEAFYVRTERTLSGERTHGTVAGIDDQELVLDVSADGIAENTYPAVGKISKEENAKIQEYLGTDGKVIAMDIALIEGNESEVEPDEQVTLSISNISGFENPVLYHVEDDGTITALSTKTTVNEDGVITSITSPTLSFSTYFIAEGKTPVKDKYEVPNTADDNPSQTSLMLVLVGGMLVLATLFFERVVHN